MKKIFSTLLIVVCIAISLAGCSSPEEKAEKYYQKGMALLESNPNKAKLEFQNALQIKKNMVKAMYGLGLVAERQGDWRAAFGMFNSVIEQQPNHIEALVKSGQIFLAGEQIELALERSSKALEVDRNNVPALCLRAAVQLKLNDSNGAVEYANKAIAKDPKSQDAYVVLATERLQAQDSAKALEYLDKALAINEKSLAVQLIKIRTLENAVNLKEAEAQYKKIILLFPDNAFVRKNFAQFLLKHDRKAEAEQELRTIAQENPKDLQAKLDVVRYVISTKSVVAGQVELESYVKKDPEDYELAFALRSLYQAQHNAAAEDQLLNQISQKAGDTADGFKARSFIALKLMQTGKKEESLKIINAILAKDKRNEQALTLRAGLELEAKNYDAAIVDLRTVLRDSPEASAAALMLANAHENSGSPELAEEHYLRAFETSKFSPNYGIPYTQFLIRRKQPERAEKVLEDTLAHNPSNATVLRALAQMKIARGDNVGAQALADQVKKSGETSPLADEILGAISSSKNDFDASINAFKRAHEAEPNQVQPIVAIVRTYMAVGKNKEAVQFIQSVLKANPNHLEAKLLLGQVYSAGGDFAHANETFADIIKIQPNNPIGYQQLAVAQQRANKGTDAEATISKGLSVAPNDFGLKLIQASILETTGRFDEAIKVYETLIKDRPDSEVVANNLASLLTDHRTDTANLNRAYVVASVFKKSETPQFLDTYGWASYKAGKLDEAEQALKQAVAKLPDTAIFHYHLAKVLIAKNDNNEAKQELQKAIKYAENQPFEQKEDAHALLKSL